MVFFKTNIVSDIGMTNTPAYYIEANRSKDIRCEVVRIFDLDPTVQWPPRQVYLVLGGYPIERMPFVEMERKRDFLTDDVMQVTWYVVYGSIHEQKNICIMYGLAYCYVYSNTSVCFIDKHNASKGAE